MKYKTDAEVKELIGYVRWYGGFKTNTESVAWLNKYIPNWVRVHDTVITYSERIGTDD